jgi:hypothetical protein
MVHDLRENVLADTLAGGVCGLSGAGSSPDGATGSEHSRCLLQTCASSSPGCVTEIANPATTHARHVRQMHRPCWFIGHIEKVSFKTVSMPLISPASAVRKFRLDASALF